MNKFVYKKIFSILFLCDRLQAYTVEVKIEQGRILGSSAITLFDRKLFYAFYRVPYAEPPTGKLRFKNPQPANKWKSVYDARKEYHGACAQAHIVHKQGLYGAEDCLHMNIFTPHLPPSGNVKLKSVIVWIHGYAFTTSLSHLHGADFLIDNDVLLVTVSHRIGVFGFLKLNQTDIHANMGLKDIVMALKWVRNNIRHFSGNKDDITVMGCGSAATFLSLLWTTKARRLFSKMILQSGSLFSPSVFQGNPLWERNKLMQLLESKGIKSLKKASTLNIIEASQKIYNNRDVINKQRPLIQFSPILEKIESRNSLLTKKPEDFMEDIKNMNVTIPILIGFNSQESISEISPFISNPSLLKYLDPVFKFMVPFNDGCSYNQSMNSYKNIAKRIKGRYFKEGVSEASLNSFLIYATDLIKYPIYRFIKKYLNVESNDLFVYKFDYVGRFNAMKTSVGNIQVRGASTGDEVCYLLKCEPLWDTYVSIKNKNTNHMDRIFIKNIVEMWTNFAKTGNPTPTNDKIRWSPMTSKEDNILLINNNMTITHTQAEERMFDFWNDIYRRFYAVGRCNAELRDEL